MCILFIAYTYIYIYVNRKVYILAHFNERLIVYSYTLYDIYKRCRQSEILKEIKQEEEEEEAFKLCTNCSRVSARYIIMCASCARSSIERFFPVFFVLFMK